MDRTHPGLVWISRFAREREDALLARWIFLRGLGLIFLSAFGSLAAEGHALVGERGILPARGYLELIAKARPGAYGWFTAPSLLWLDASDRAISALIALGVVGALLLFFNVAPRWAALACTVAFLSFTSTLRDFASYQSDGMLMEAGAAAVLFAPRGLRPGLGASAPPSYASWMLLVWEWFRIYFESGVAKIASGDPSWRDLTAMDRYYERGPLPTWLAWHAQALPHAFHAFTVILTFVAEIPLPVLALVSRRARAPIALFLAVFQLCILATANYCFINYLTLLLSILLLDDARLSRLRLRVPRGPALRPRSGPARALHAFFGVWVLYASIAVFALRGAPPELAFLASPARALAPFRVGERYALFAVMTPARWELELQGSRDGLTWVPYPFRYKPQDPREAPKIFAPYQPRFEWNLWFCSLSDDWQDCTFVYQAAARLLEREPHVLALFRADPFASGGPPRYVRVVKYEYWFTREAGAVWRRELLGAFGPTLERAPSGEIVMTLPEERL